MKLKEIRRTATFAWSPTAEPLLATGTVAGALDESFSNDSFLEIWEPDFMDKTEYELGGQQQKAPKAVVTTTSRFNRLAWGFPSSGRGKGVIAAGMENGELGLWDPEKVLSTSDATESLILRNTTHQGSVRGLDFNPIQTNLLSSGATNGEIYIWDLKDPSKPYSPGARSSKLDEITALAWNRQVQHVLASSSNTGYTVVWDLRNKREVVALQYGGQGQAIVGGGRAGMSDVAWHPDNATRLVTASDDDNTPVVMLWDLRNAHAPVKLLSGHEKGVLSLSWCEQDSDLLLSCGKDNRSFCWNPQSAEIIGELPYSNNWAFRVQWCPRNPDLIATADYDGTIGIHSLQSTNDSVDQQVAPTPKADGSDVFDVPGFSRTTQSTLSLKQPPKWLRRPISSSFGYGGKLVSVSNLQSAQGTNQSSVVHLRKLVTEPTIVDRAKKLKAATEGEGLEAFANEKANVNSGHADETWKALSTLFTANSRDELVALLGFSKAESATRVSEAVEKIKANVTPTIPPHVDIEYIDVKPHEPIVSFAEPELTPTTPEAEQELTPSEPSTSVTSGTTESTRPADGESTTTVPSLFDDDVGTPQLDAEADFFSSMGTIRNALPEHNQIPHQNYAHDSSVAATIGSRPSSAASEAMKNNTFKIYPSEEPDIDSLVTKSLILGDFESAVALCLSAERYADAILLAVKGSPDLLQRTQKAYFEKRTVNLPYLRLFQSIVTEDLDDIVQNADLQEWQEIFVVLCTFAKADEFSNLAEQLGQRLEFQASLMKNMESPGAEDLRKNATLAYLAAGRLEKVINIWIEEMSEDEARLLGNFDEKSSSRYSAHAHALQTLMEKVAIFRGATNYVDGDLDTTQESSAMRTYKLSGLYERYFEYADLLAAQGLLDEAVSFLKLIPAKYESDGNCDFDFSVARERLLEAAKVPVASTSRAAASSSYVPASSSTTFAQQSYPSFPSQQHLAAGNVPARTMSPAKQAPSYPTYGANGSAVPSQPVNTYTPLNVTSAPPSQQYQPTAPMQPYGNVPSTLAPPPGRPQQAVNLPPPPPKKKDEGGWNDAPSLVRERRPPSTNPVSSKAPITAPFPGANSSPSSGPGSPAMYGQSQVLPPPPPRPGSVNRGSVPPPPPPGQVRPPPGAQHGPPGPGNYLPPQRTFSPAQGGQHQGPPGPPPQRGPAQYAPPPPQNRSLSSPQNLGPPQQPAGRGLAPPPPRGPGMPPAGGQYAQPPPGGWGPPGRAPPGPFPPGSPVGRPGSLGPPGAPSAPSHDMYAPPPGSGPRQPPPPAGVSALGLQQNNQMGSPPSGPPPASTPSGGSPNTTRSPPMKQGPPPPKYPPGDRSHIPDASRGTYEILLNEINRLKQSPVPVPKRFVDDIDHRMNTLFDAMNCDTLSPMVTEKLGELSSAVESRNQGAALTIHSDLLQQSSASSRPEDNIGSWMAAVRQLIMRMQ